jgi:hypothetical protein
MGAPDGEVLSEAAREVDILRDFPQLLTLIEETSQRAPTAGEVGLASRNDPAGVLWLLLAGDDASSADLDALARAFVWPSYARARPPAAYLRTGDPFAEAALRLAPGGVVALLSPSDRSSACAQALQWMFEARERRPAGAVVAPRQIGRVLRDFEDAVARGDVAAARDLVDEAWATGRLSLVNRSYLQTRVLAAQRAWGDVLDHATRHRLPDLELPRAVENDLVTAVYWSLLHEPLAQGDVASAIDTFRQRVQPKWGDVFRDHRGVVSPEGRKAWMLRLAGIDTDWPSVLRDELLAAATEGERALLVRIAEHVRFTESSSARFATALLTAREDAAAFSLAEADPEIPGPERAGILVRAAVRLDDATRLHVAAEAVQAVGSAEAVAAPAVLVDRVSSQPRPSVAVVSWSTWLHAVFDDPEWPDALRVAIDNGDAWTESVARGADTLTDAPELVEALAGEEALRAALPRLVRAAIPEGEHRVESVRARRRLLQALAYAVSEDPASGVADLDALADILAALLEAGLSSEDFARLCDQIELVWRRMGSPPRLARWVVDVLAIFTGYPCPNEPRRAQIVGALLSPLTSDASRAIPIVPREVWLEIDGLLETSGLAELVPAVIQERSRLTDEDGTEDFAHLADKTILIYTLVPGAAERAAAYLRRLVPSSHLIADDSHVGSAQLRERVRKANVVVIASRASKHAATDFIREAASSPIAWASGKGWSSLVNALRPDSALA